MTSAAFHREEARRCREGAAASTDPVEAEQLRRFAREQETLARLLEENGNGGQHQQAQQQQKAEPEDDK